MIKTSGMNLWVCIVSLMKKCKVCKHVLLPLSSVHRPPGAGTWSLPLPQHARVGTTRAKKQVAREESEKVWSHELCRLLLSDLLIGVEEGEDAEID